MRMSHKDVRAKRAPGVLQNETDKVLTLWAFFKTLRRTELTLNMCETISGPISGARVAYTWTDAH